MGESRLSSLALMHIKYDMPRPVDLDEIVNLFQGLAPPEDDGIVTFALRIAL